MITINNIQIIIDNIKDLSSFHDKYTMEHEQIFDIRADRLEQLDDAEFYIICNFIEQCANLKSIYLPNITIVTLDKRLRLSLLCNSMSKCRQLESLNLSGLNIETVTFVQLEQISKVISSLQNLQSLTLAWISLHELNIKDTKMLFDAVISLPMLQTLNLEGIGLDEINDEHFQIVCDTICKCSKLKNIELYQAELDYMDFERFDKLCDIIAKTSSLVSCVFTSKQNSSIEERNQRIERLLQKKQAPAFPDLEIVSYFSAKQRSKGPNYRKRAREDSTVPDETSRISPSDSCSTTFLRP